MEIKQIKLCKDCSMSYSGNSCKNCNKNYKIEDEDEDVCFDELTSMKIILFMLKYDSFPAYIKCDDGNYKVPKHVVENVLEIFKDTLSKIPPLPKDIIEPFIDKTLFVLQGKKNKK